MFELMAIGIGQGIIDFATSMIVDGRYKSKHNFKLLGIDNEIKFDAILNKEDRNLHMIIDIDINY